MSQRTFETAPAVRERTPLLVGLVGPSGTGKTYSALRLATGIQRVTGGDIHCIDTEARRALHYADKFKFKYTPFSAPFGPLDYLAAVEHCRAQGAGVIVVDSASHEHEGPGGVLEMHEAEVTRLSRGNADKADGVKMLAWGKPKRERRAFINAILQMPVNFVFCFRAKEKLKIQRDKNPEPLGWMAIAAEEFIYEMTLNAMLLPGANGSPSWQSEFPGERSQMKLPTQFRALFGDAPQLSEDIGQRLAEWAAGGKPAPTAQHQADAGTADVAALIERYRACADRAAFEAAEADRAKAWPKLGADAKRMLKTESDTARDLLAANEAEAKPTEGAPRD